MAEFAPAFNRTKIAEGGFVDHPLDPGGPTNHGVSLRFLRSLDPALQMEFDKDRDGDVDVDDIRGLTLDDARKLFRRVFWLPMYEALANQDIATKVFDISVNTGLRQAALIVQRAVCAYDVTIAVDGHFGPITAAKLNTFAEYQPRLAMEAIRAQQLRFYVKLVEDDRERREPFLFGWSRRALDLV